jgi:hypothetical protein
MDSDDCILNLKIIYKEKSFNISSEDIITINEIKEEAIKNFNIMDKDKNNIKLFLKKGQKDLIISSENDIIQNADDSDINNPKLDINLLIESKEESISKEEPISKEDKSILQNEQISKNISKINNISEEKLKDIKNENEIKYNELKIIIEKMSNEIKILKEDQINKHKILENNNINIKNEIEGYKKQFEIINIYNSKLIEENAKLKEMFREEINKINEVNKNYKNLENLFRKKCMEISDFKNQIIESFDKYIKEFKLNYENKKNEIKSDNSENILNLLKNKIEENINNLEQKYNNTINSSIKDLEKKIEGQYNNINAIMNGVIQELFKKINENKKEIRFLKESSINLNNINKTNKNMIIDESSNESNINNENKKINNKNEFSLLYSSKNILNNSKNFDSKDKENLNLDKNEVSLFSNNNPNNKQKMIIGQKQDMDKIKELRNKFKEKLKDISDEKLQELLDKYGEFDSSLIIDFNNE